MKRFFCFIVAITFGMITMGVLSPRAKAETEQSDRDMMITHLATQLSNANLEYMELEQNFMELQAKNHELEEENAELKAVISLYAHCFDEYAIFRTAEPNPDLNWDGVVDLKDVYWLGKYINERM